MPRKPYGPEALEARALTQWREMSLPRNPALKWLMHIPNGGKRPRGEAGKLKAEGVLPKVADYLLPVRRGGYNGLWVELKAPGNYPDEGQREFLLDMRLAGFAAHWAMGWEEAVDIIMNYLNEGPINGRKIKGE